MEPLPPGRLHTLLIQHHFSFIDAHAMSRPEHRHGIPNESQPYVATAPHHPQPFVPQQQFISQQQAQALQHFQDEVRRAQEARLDKLIRNAFSDDAQKFAADVAVENEKLSRQLSSTDSKLTSISTKLDEHQRTFSSQLKDAHTSCQTSKSEEQQQTRYCLLELKEGMEKLRTDQDNLSAVIKQQQQNTQELVEKLLHNMEKLAAQNRMDDAASQRLTRNLLSETAARQEELLKLFTPLEDGPRMKTRSSKKRSGDALQKLPPVIQTAVEALMDVINVESCNTSGDKVRKNDGRGKDRIKKRPRRN